MDDIRAGEAEQDLSPGCKGTPHPAPVADDSACSEQAGLRLLLRLWAGRRRRAAIAVSRL